MFRVINEDLSFNGEKNIIAVCNTIEEAKQCEADNYIFNTSVEAYINEVWECVLINGLTEDEWEQFI